MSAMQATELDHYYTFGDVYETLDACDQLQLLLGRLQRQHLLSDADWKQSRQEIAQIRARLESRLPPSR